MGASAPNLFCQMLLLEIFYKNAPARQVPEYSEIELHLTNSGQMALDNLTLRLGQEKLRGGLSLRPGGSFAFPYNVGDLVGDLSFTVNQTQPLVEASLSVTPRRMSLEEVQWIKTERLPALLARLDAPNRLPLSYDDEEQPRLFDFVSADFTAIKLRYFCQQLLDKLNERLLERLDFNLNDERKREDGFIRGGVRWDATVRGWLNRPAETGLVHEWVETPRTYDTLPNRLFLGFLVELGEECRLLVKLVQTGAPASARLKEALPEFENYAYSLEQQAAALKELAHLASFESGEFNPRDPGQWPEIERACLGVANPAYPRLAELWQEYSRRYTRLPEIEVDQAGLQPMSKIYELWAACEVASALGLTSEGKFGLESAIFQGNDIKLHYNRAAPGGWYSAGPDARKRPPRPDLRLEFPDGAAVLLDVKYRAVSGNGEESARAHPDDMYRMLAYMNDFGVRQGGIIFPGASPGSDLQLIEQSAAGQRLAELALRPPYPNDQTTLENWQTKFKAHLEQLLF